MARENRMRRLMVGSEYRLDGPRRKVLKAAIVSVCAERRWDLRALHVRSNHFHCVIGAEEAKGRVIGCLKAIGSRCLGKAGLDRTGTRRWARGGSCLFLWDEKAVAEAIDYVLHRQGVPMETYPDGGPDPAVGKARKG